MKRNKGDFYRQHGDGTVSKFVDPGPLLISSPYVTDFVTHKSDKFVQMPIANITKLIVSQNYGQRHAAHIVLKIVVNNNVSYSFLQARSNEINATYDFIKMFEKEIGLKKYNKKFDCSMQQIHCELQKLCRTFAKDKYSFKINIVSKTGTLKKSKKNVAFQHALQKKKVNSFFEWPKRKAYNIPVGVGTAAPRYIDDHTYKILLREKNELQKKYNELSKKPPLPMSTLASVAVQTRNENEKEMAAEMMKDLGKKYRKLQMKYWESQREVQTLRREHVEGVKKNLQNLREFEEQMNNDQKLLQKELDSLKKQRGTNMVMRNKYSALINERKECKQKYSASNNVNDDILRKFEKIKAEREKFEAKWTKMRCKTKKVEEITNEHNKCLQMDKCLQNELKNEKTKNEVLEKMIKECQQMNGKLKEKLGSQIAVSKNLKINNAELHKQYKAGVNKLRIERNELLDASSGTRRECDSKYADAQKKRDDERASLKKKFNAFIKENNGMKMENIEIKRQNNALLQLKNEREAMQRKLGNLQIAHAKLLDDNYTWKKRERDTLLKIKKQKMTALHTDMGTLSSQHEMKLAAMTAECEKNEMIISQMNKSLEHKCDLVAIKNAISTMPFKHKSYF